MHAAAAEHGGRVSVACRGDTSESSRQTTNLNRHTPKTRTIDLLSWRQHSLSKGLAGMTTQQQIDIEFDSLARENDSPKLIRQLEGDRRNTTIRYEGAALNLQLF